jgi:hypothetical protein
MLVNGTNYYYFDPDFGNSVGLRKDNGTNTLIAGSTYSTSINTDYRAKVRVGSANTNESAVWLNNNLVASGTDTTPFSSGTPALWVSDYSGGRSVTFDNLAIYKSTRLAVNGTYGSWALYANNGTTRIGNCNSSANVDYATITSFPVDYANGSAAQIKVWPSGNTTCDGNELTSFVGGVGSEIFGGDIYQLN